MFLKNGCFYLKLAITSVIPKTNVLIQDFNEGQLLKDWLSDTIKFSFFVQGRLRSITLNTLDEKKRHGASSAKVSVVAQATERSQLLKKSFVIGQIWADPRERIKNLTQYANEEVVKSDCFSFSTHYISIYVFAFLRIKEVNSSLSLYLNIG
ncbi:hypothetical protein FF38_08704 [Lucilia cuprina]|uniref:Uncharacterized protein n=1 Tax=Lucilia cuprina TaxID=7375 RepID=A0A0L0BY46_LUCCU|nr:hypothetical protein FF38_08704 [Lucilia cuprina]